MGEYMMDGALQGNSGVLGKAAFRESGGAR